MKKLLVYTENHLGGGANRYLADLVNGLAPVFDQVTVASNHGGFPVRDAAKLTVKAELAELPVFTRDMLFIRMGFFRSGPGRLLLKLLLPLDPLVQLYNFLVCGFFLLKEKPVAVLACNGGYPGGKSAHAMCLASAALGLRTVMSVVSTPVPRRYGFLTGLADALLWKALDFVIANAGFVASSLINMRGLPAAKARVIHNGIAAPSPAPAARPYGDEFVFGCVGRIERAKGVYDLFEAFCALLAKRAGVKLVLVGPRGDAFEALAAQIRERRLEGKVLLQGPYYGEITELVSAFDAFVLPSLWEGLPYVVLEAMSCGKPVIATSVGGIPEAITDGQEGLLVPPAALGDLAAAMERLAADTSVAAALGARGRAKFEQEFTLGAMHANLRRTWGAAEV